MNPIVINGTVLCDNITGIPRYVYENVVRLDKLIEGTGLDVRIAYRDDGRPIHLPELKNIRLVPLKSIPYFYNLAVLPAYLRRTHAFYVGLASDMLLTRRSVVVLHDIRPLVLDTDKGFFRFKFWVHCLSTKWFAQRVFTVSDNQRHLISEKLGIPLDKIGITYNGWEHMKNVTPDESIFDKMPGVKKGEYFYALGSLAKHKNFKWIREVARRSPDKTFVVAGGKDLRAFGDDAEAKDTHNVFYPGYVSDAENAALMKHCKLFLHPAVFEGFGIPPLEALALGAPVALANATCLPELYGDTARYFDPYDYDVDLDALAAQPVAAGRDAERLGALSRESGEAVAASTGYPLLGVYPAGGWDHILGEEGQNRRVLAARAGEVCKAVKRQLPQGKAPQASQARPAPHPMGRLSRAYARKKPPLSGEVVERQ